ncbi:16S rRNA (uracil(1498)-N(3))-methyltransferase [Segnochrobactrum spirostomi]|uniref:Ribosomal RNA small subunit methyltransferase E n=1 Tax=Segnochrobactrum spirostomi TaxID=2608987 RepID=A0A6A7Y757_9HYPH|nr:16S rRNA (uracil(1498)-N(3))-methyltransferase [Segnochrobactrum spirostomi]MQT13492.1 16S rRNA (uracil(1498)-N(3))-methyltransferase [Segnochrobactrum spirostomi]
MPRHDFLSTRLFVEAPLEEGARVEATREQANYLLSVLRKQPGDGLLVFNGRDGEWRASVAEASRKTCVLSVDVQTRAQTPQPDVHLLFAPLKHARLDYMVQKAVEMGAGVLRPVMTRHTQASRVNLERMRANVVEACEQCGVIAVPEVRDTAGLDGVLDRWEAEESGRRIVFCDETAETTNPMPTLATLGRGPAAVLIGPEGGFSADERERLRRMSLVTAIPLGPRILRADTAAVAALAVVQAALGDWT